MPLGSFFESEDLAVVPVEDLKASKRRAQTEKARVQAQVVRAVRKSASSSEATYFPRSDDVDDASPATARHIQRKCLTKSLYYSHALSLPETILDPEHRRKEFQQDRARCAWSLVSAIVKGFEALLCGPDQPRVKFIVNTIIPDDTNTRLKGEGKRDRSLVFTVMNTVQSCIVQYSDPLGPGAADWHCLFVPCPVMVLKTPNTENLHAAYAAQLVVGANGVGKTWKSVGVSPSVEQGIASAKWALQVMCGDALEANSSAFRLERVILACKREAGPCTSLALRLKCLNHQLGLIRKPVVLAVEKYWSTLVRLSNLFQCASFRRKFTAALVSLMHKPGRFHCVLALSCAVSLPGDILIGFTGGFLPA